jgi:hypothetical protein
MDNKSILELSALVTAKRGFPVTYKISDLQSQILAAHPCTGSTTNKSAVP